MDRDGRRLGFRLEFLTVCSALFLNQNAPLRGAFLVQEIVIWGAFFEFFLTYEVVEIRFPGAL